MAEGFQSRIESRLKRLLPAQSGGKLVVTNLLLIVIGYVMYPLFMDGLLVVNYLHDASRVIFVILAQSLLYVGAVWIVWRARAARSTLIIVIVFAALFRLGALFAPPGLSTDIYRYVWDGRVQAAGINPYRYIPSDEALAHLRDEAIYPNINRPEYAHTIYPPIAQMIFLVVTRAAESVTLMKMAMVGFEAIAVLALMSLLASFGHPRHRVLAYAWNPLLVIEIAGNGHVDAPAIAFIALALLARRRRLDAATGVALAAATLIKFFPVVIFPALYRRWDWKMPLAFAATIALAYLPYLSVGTGALGFLPRYTEEEGLQSGARFFLLSLARRVLPGMGEAGSAAYLAVALAVLAAIAVWSLVKAEPTGESYIKRALVLAASFTFFLSPRYPWYYAWLIVFFCAVPFAPLLLVTTLSIFIYAEYGEFITNAGLYGLFALLSLITLADRRRRSESVTQPARSLGGELT
jgi:hypothetical protein